MLFTFECELLPEYVSTLDDVARMAGEFGAVVVNAGSTSGKRTLTVGVDEAVVDDLLHLWASRLALRMPCARATLRDGGHHVPG